VVGCREHRTGAGETEPVGIAAGGEAEDELDAGNHGGLHLVGLIYRSLRAGVSGSVEDRAVSRGGELEGADVAQVRKFAEEGFAVACWDCDCRFEIEDAVGMKKDFDQPAAVEASAPVGEEV
jgi:hypothetical protein